MAILFRRRTDLAFSVVFLATLLVCLYLNLSPKTAAAAATLTGFVAAGFWLVVVEDALNPNKRGD